jgi:glycosyltransferase involved in cell wall biosynthesis
MTQPTADYTETPLISVVIPAYNCAPYLARAIDSVLNQTYQNIECIVVDDGSTDETPQILDAFASRVSRIRQENAGASAARNTGINAAHGTYIAFLDADDYWLPTKLSAQVQALIENPDLVLISCDFVWASPSMPDADESPAYEPERLRVFHTLTQLLRNPYLGTPTVVVKSEAIKRIGGFDTSLPVGEDVDLYFRLCTGQSYARLDQALAVFQLRPGSLTTDIRGYAENLKVLDRVERLLAGPDARDHALLQALRLEVYQNWISALLGRRAGREVRRLLKDSQQVGRLPTYHLYYLKSFITPLLPYLRRLREAFSRTPCSKRRSA